MNKEIIYYLFSNVLNKFITFLIFPLIARNLGAEELGDYDIYLMVGLIFDTIFSFKINEAFVRYSVRKPERILSYFNVSIGFLGLIYFSFLPVFIFIGDYDLLLIFIISFFKNIYIINNEYERIRGKVNYYTIFLNFNNLIFISALIFIFMLSEKIEVSNILEVMLLSLLASIFFQLCISKKQLSLLRKIEYKLIVKRFLNFSVPLIPSAISWWIIKGSNRFFIDNAFSREDVGIIAMYSFIPNIIVAFGLVLYTSVQKNIYIKQRSSSLLVKSISNYNQIILMVAVSAVLFSEPLLKFMFELDVFDENLFILMVVNSVLFTYSSMLALVYTTYYDSKSLMYSTILSALVIIVLSYAVVSVNTYSSILNLMLATTFGLMGLAIMRHYHLRRNFSISIPFSNFGVVLSITLLIVHFITKSVYFDFILMLLVLAYSFKIVKTLSIK